MTSSSQGKTDASVVQRALAAVKELRGRLAAFERARNEPVAVIGLSCRFPGARDPDAFWDLLRNGVDAVREVPPDRWDADAFHDPDPDALGKITTKQGGFLDEVDLFDAAFFRISPREALRLDPQQRLLLEVAWEALERAGQSDHVLEGSRTGVFIGITNNDYGALIRRAGLEAIDAYFATGNALNAAAGRLSYALGLQGPSVAVDAACASSLVAIHLACQSLRADECRVALAGGVNLILAPDAHVAMSRAHAMAPDGRCKTFDARADGYGRGEGCGVVVLKLLAEALADKDPIFAVLRGSAVLQDGRSGGLTVPNGAAQQAVIRRALDRAGVTPSQVSYVEAHGTGTSLGDPIEVRALGAVMGRDRPSDQPLVLGSVKANIGHLESAAGVAALIKVVLALRHGEIPPHIHLRELNPDIAEEPTPKLIPSIAMAWPREPRIAGVSAFGLTGTIAHAIVEQAPEPTTTEPALDGAQLLPISARSPQALVDLARSYRELLLRPGAPPLCDVCYTAALRRTHHEHRLAVAGASHAELADRLQAFIAGDIPAGFAAGERARDKLVFVFPGQGGQWPGMARDLLADPIFRAEIERVEVALKPHVDWSLIEVLAADPADPRLERIDVIQPTLFAIQLALAALWRSFGITPDAVIGHSMGEVAAACGAGCLSLVDAARVIVKRSQILRRTSGRGAMALVELPLDQAERALQGYEHAVSVAASNGPTTTVLSGDPAALAEILAALQAKEIFCRPINVDVASHSPQMEALQPDLEHALSGIVATQAQIPFYSTVLAESIKGPELSARYWIDNLRKPVLFAPAVERLLADGYPLFIEISPHPTLPIGIQELLRRSGREGAVLSSLRREQPGRAALLASLGSLYALGHPVDWARQHASGRRCVDLPTYPWQRERFWIDTAEAGSLPRRRAKGAAALLGERLRSPALQASVFESELSLAALPLLADHCIGGEVVVPGACHLARVLCAARDLFDSAPCTLRDVNFPSALVLQKDEARTAQLILERDGSFRTLTAERGAEHDESAWTLHAAGWIEKGSSVSFDAPTLEQVRSRCASEKSGADFYAEMARASYGLGQRFQWLDQIQFREGEAIGRLRTPRAADGVDDYPLYPGLLDSCFQLIAVTSRARGVESMADGDELYVPIGVRYLRYHQRSGAPAWCHVVAGAEDPAHPDEISAEIRLLDHEGAALAEVGFRGKRVEREVFLHGPRIRHEPFFELAWRELARSAAPSVPASGVRWLIVRDEGGIGARLAKRLEHGGATCLVVGARAVREREAAQRAIEDALGGASQLRGIVYLGSLDAASTHESTAEEASRACAAVLHLVQAQARAGLRDAPRFWIVTAGAQAAGDAGARVSVAQAPLWGLARVIASEHAELRCTCVDLSPAPDEVELGALADELVADDKEDQLALRGERRLVARLVRRELGQIAAAAVEAPEPAAERPFRLEIDVPGVLEHLVLRPIERRPPRAGEVEIEVRAAGINFVDVLSALGVRPDQPEGGIQLGGECAGVVTAVGDGVRDLAPGDEVISAIAPHCFASHVTVPSTFVVPKPAALGFEDAATIPIAFMTAHFAMHHKARLRRGERILIHAASGGVGLAAVQLARRVGAEIFATAGSEQKRDYLRGLGIEHVMDSRSLAFADEIRARTDGHGVDVVLNCLTGEALEKSLGVLAPYGRFLEIGKRDVYDDKKLGLYVFRQNLSYFFIDLIRMFQERPREFAELLAEVVALFADRSLTPLPLSAFPISQARDAFRLMAQAKHTGKLVLTLPDPEVLLAPSPSDGRARFRADASYLVTGGLGGLGLTVARWMIERGARHVALASRSAPSAAAKDAIAALERSGARVLVSACDVARRDEVERLLALIDAELPPLRGIVHAAGLLDDGALLQQTPERFFKVMAPKVAGSWNLHSATSDRRLDFFVLFSGAGSLLGSPGQSNYAAANAFLDALAHARRAEGLPAQSIAWGPWSEVGLAARPDRAGRLALRGVGSISPDQGVEALGRVMLEPTPHVAVLPLDLRRCFQSYPALAEAPLFELLANEKSATREPAADAAFRRTLAAAEPVERRGLLEAHLREQTARVLGLSPARIDVGKPLGSLGFDSLMTLELRNRVESSLGVRLSATAAFNHPTIAALTNHLARTMNLDLGEAAPAQPPSEVSERIAAVEALSDDEAAALLAEKLRQVEKSGS